MSRSLVVASALALTVALGTPASAGPAGSMGVPDEYARVAQELVVGSLQRARQAIAIGPFLGGFAGSAGGDGVGGVSFGLGLYTFDRPSILELQEIVATTLRARVKATIADAIAHGGTPLDERAAIAQILAELRAELIGEAAVHTLEKPSLGLVLEGAVLSDGWSTRIGASKGIGRASLGLGAGLLRASGDTVPFVGLDLSVRATPTGVHRTPVFELYARADLGFADAGKQGIYLAGLRVLLDLL